MSDKSSESALSYPRLLAVRSCGFSASSPIEREVVQLFDDFRNSLLRYLLGFGLTVADSEEIVQEIFLALFQHLQKGKSRQNLRGWIFRVGHNLALKKRNLLRREAEIAPDSLGKADPSLNPEDQWESRSKHQRLQAVVNSLPEQDRQCLFLRAEGLRYREIAEILGMSLGWIANSLQRSLGRLARVAER